jgi:hypothetical protein
MPNTLIIICFFTFLIHITEAVAYSMRLAGLRTGQIAISMAFVTSTLLVSRLSNMFQAPLLGNMLDSTIMIGTPAALSTLEFNFRLVIFAGFLGSLAGAFITPTVVNLFQKAIKRFLICGSVPRVMLSVLRPRNTWLIIKSFRFPRLKNLRGISIKNSPKTFLILNSLVASIYTIGVLCSLLAGAYMPDLRSTANQLSGIVNGLATIMFTIFVDPSGARITDQAVHGTRQESDVKSVVFFLQIGRLFGTLIIAQLAFKPFTLYIIEVTKWISGVVN